MSNFEINYLAITFLMHWISIFSRLFWISLNQCWCENMDCAIVVISWKNSRKQIHSSIWLLTEAGWWSTSTRGDIPSFWILDDMKWANRKNLCWSRYKNYNSIERTSCILPEFETFLHLRPLSHYVSQLYKGSFGGTLNVNTGRKW